LMQISITANPNSESAIFFKLSISAPSFTRID
jgi:hypothetical protein